MSLLKFEGFNFSFKSLNHLNEILKFCQQIAENLKFEILKFCQQIAENSKFKFEKNHLTAVS